MHRVLTVTLALLAASASADAPDIDALQTEARQLAQQFVGQLKPQLKSAMQEGGPAHAIQVCADRAPAIADALSSQSGWQVKRVSLKSRNASRAVPDAWEREILLQFDARQAAGEAPSQLNYGELAGSNYRYIQAQGVEPLCLVCHGDSLSQSVIDTLSEYYPDDWATGYTAGQVRGAISLVKPLPAQP